MINNIEIDNKLNILYYVQNKNYMYYEKYKDTIEKYGNLDIGRAFENIHTYLELFKKNSPQYNIEQFKESSWVYDLVIDDVFYSDHCIKKSTIEDELHKIQENIEKCNEEIKVVLIDKYKLNNKISELKLNEENRVNEILKEIKKAKSEKIQLLYMKEKNPGLVFGKSYDDKCQEWIDNGKDVMKEVIKIKYSNSGKYIDADDYKIKESENYIEIATLDEKIQEINDKIENVEMNLLVRLKEKELNKFKEETVKGQIEKTSEIVETKELEEKEDVQEIENIEEIKEETKQEIPIKIEIPIRKINKESVEKEDKKEESKEEKVEIKEPIVEVKDIDPLDKIRNGVIEDRINPEESIEQTKQVEITTEKNEIENNVKSDVVNKEINNNNNNINTNEIKTEDINKSVNEENSISKLERLQKLESILKGKNTSNVEITQNNVGNSQKTTLLQKEMEEIKNAMYKKIERYVDDEEIER